MFRRMFTAAALSIALAAGPSCILKYRNKEQVVRQAKKCEKNSTKGKQFECLVEGVKRCKTGDHDCERLFLLNSNNGILSARKLVRVHLGDLRPGTYASFYSNQTAYRAAGKYNCSSGLDSNDRSTIPVIREWVFKPLCLQDGKVKLKMTVRTFDIKRRELTSKQFVELREYGLHKESPWLAREGDDGLLSHDSYGFLYRFGLKYLIIKGKGNPDGITSFEYIWEGARGTSYEVSAESGTSWHYDRTLKPCK